MEKNVQDCICRVVVHALLPELMRKMHQLFGNEMSGLVEDLNEALVA